MYLLSPIPKLSALFFFLAFSFSNLSAQGWFNVYPELYPSPEETELNGNTVRMFEGVIETEDNGFITWGAYNYQDIGSGFGIEYEYNPINIRLTKTDLVGNVQWTQLYEQGISPAFDDLLSFKMAASPDGNGYLGFGKTTNSAISTFRGIHLDDDGTVLNTFELTETDLIGTTLAGPNASNTKLIEIVPSPDNTFIVLGSNYYPYYQPEADDNPTWLAKVNMDGIVQWSTIADNTVQTPGWVIPTTQTTLMMSDLDVSSSGEIAIAGICSTPSYGSGLDAITAPIIQKVFKYDTNGNELWSNQRTINNSNEFASVIVHPNGDLYVKGHESYWGGRMARLSAIGDTVWTETYDFAFFTENSTTYIPIDFCVLSDGNIGILQVQRENYSTENQNLRFVKIDENNNAIYTGNPFLSSLHSDNYSQIGEEPYDIDLIATSDNSMVLAAQYSYFEGDDDWSAPWPQTSSDYTTAYPYLTKPGPNGEIPTTLLSGHVFIDSNGNCIYDAGEVGVAQEIVYSEYFAVITDQNGYYEATIAVDETHNISTNFGQIYPTELWNTDCEESLELYIDPNGPEITGTDFGFVADYECPRLEVDLSIPFIRPGFTDNLGFISYENTGTLPEDDITIQVRMDSIYSITPGTSSIPFTFDATTNTYEFAVGTLDIFESGFIFFELTCPIEVELGRTPCFEAVILPFDRCGLQFPDWDGSELRLDAICEGDSIRFTIENIGEEDMQMSRSYSIYVDDLLIQIGDVELLSGQGMDVVKYATGNTFRMNAEQSENFPEPSSPEVSIEMCNATNGPSTMGLINTSARNDEAHYIDIECTTVSGSFDPNDKNAAPSGISSQNYVNSDVELEYTIRFQNTGTDTAFNVFVLDTLSEFLDINTFDAGPASHEYELSILPGRVLRWDFPNILLPDSTTNLVGSNGALKFTIRSVQGIPQPTEIHNTAAIFFDFNEPIITEDMFVTICDECLIQTLATEGVYFDGKVLLEGPYNGAGLMANDLQDLIPMNQPFANFPYFYDGNEQLSQVPANMVDWVLVEARSGTPAISGNRATTTVETQAAILLNDGSIRGVDGLSGVRFVNLTSDTPYHFCIRHRNHLDVLTATALFPTENMVYDFTTGTSQALGAAQLKWFGADAKAVMYSGDFNSDGVIQTTDYDVWSSQPAAVEVYDLPDANLDGVIQVSDYDKWFFNKAKVGNVEIGF